MLFQRTESVPPVSNGKEKALSAGGFRKFRHHCAVRAFFHSFLRAGLTVEAACVLPLFLWAVLGAFYLMEISAAQTRLLGGIRDTARKMAIVSYGLYGGNSNGGKELSAGTLVEGALTSAYAKGQILKKAALEETLLSDQIRVTLAASDFSDKNIIDLRVISSIQIPIPFYRLRRWHFLERGYVRAWTGRSPGEESGNTGGGDTQSVYVTVTGSVYHRDLNCSHIKLNIASGSMADMKHKRSADGSKYYPCSCYKSHASDTVYYAKNGNRYHSSLSCSGLKRTVKKVKLSSVEGWKACSKCG